MKRLFFITLLLLITSACRDDCKSIDCFTPPMYFNMELIGKQTGKDLLATGIYNYDQVSVQDRETGKTVGYNTIRNDSIDLIQFDKIGWKTEVVDYAITIADSVHFGLYVDATRTNENCCSFTRYNEVKIEDAQYNLDSLSDIYKIFIE